MGKTIVALVAIASSAMASAQSFQFLAECGTDNRIRSYALDTESVRKDGDTVYVTLKGDHSRYAGSQSLSSKLIWSISCANRTFLELERTEYAADGSVLFSYSEPTDRMRVSRDGVSGKVFAKVCA